MFLLIFVLLFLQGPNRFLCAYHTLKHKGCIRPLPPPAFSCAETKIRENARKGAKTRANYKACAEYVKRSAENQIQHLNFHFQPSFAFFSRPVLFRAKRRENARKAAKRRENARKRAKTREHARKRQTPVLKIRFSS